MKLTRKQLRNIINEQVFGIKQMSQWPVLRTLGINTPSERKKVNACKQAANIITNLNIPRSNLFQTLNFAVSLTYNYYKAKKENKNISRKFKGFVPNQPFGVGYVGVDEGDAYTRWLSTEGRNFNPSNSRRSRNNPTEESFGYKVPDEMFDLIPLLHIISKADINKPGFWNAVRGTKRTPPAVPDYEALPPDEHGAAYARYNQERQESLTNLEQSLSSSLTIPGEQTVLGVFGSRLDQDTINILNSFIDGISKCSSENGGIEISF